VIVLHISFDPAAYYLADPLWSPGKSGVEWKPLPGLPAAEPLKSEGCARRIAEDLIRSVETGAPSGVSGAEGRAALEMVHAVYASHLKGAREPLPLRNRKHPLA